LYADSGSAGHPVHMSAQITPSISLKGRRRTEIVIFAVIFVALALFVTRYISHEHYIYFWDFIQYHIFYIKLGQVFAVAPFVALRSVFLSVSRRDYNLLPTLFLMPFRLAFGPGRLSYILSITFTFVFPSIVLFSHAVKNLRGNRKGQGTFDEVGLTLLSLLAFAFLPALWIPVVIGSLDVGGIIIILIILMLSFRTDLIEQSWGNLVTIALLLSLLILFRRWYAYWVVGFFGAMAVCEGLKCALNKERRTHLMLIARNVLAMGTVSFLSFFLVATPIASKMLSTNYGDIYSAYRSSHPFLHNLRAIYDHFGLVTIALAGLGIVVSGMNDKRRPMVCFLCVQFAIAFVLFARTQDFIISSRGQEVGVQHLYWALPTLGFFLVLFAQDAFLWVHSRGGKAAIVLLLLVLSLANFSRTFFPRAANPLKAVEFALPNSRQYPMVRNDLDQMRALLDTLNEISKSPGSMIYILSSSFSLNSSIAQQGSLLLEPAHVELERMIIPTYDVDKRDGFPRQFLGARYVVLTMPFGYHLPPQDQRVIGILADQIVKGEGIGSSYDKLEYEFKLEDGSSAFIYRKDRPLDPYAVKGLSDQFMDFYPNHRDKFDLSPELIHEVSVLH
jgi:hypothetical protein